MPKTTVFSQSLPFQNYQEPSGLPSPIVYCIYQDSNGFLWFGTAKGLSRYDGNQFQNLKKESGLPGNNVNSILEDRERFLWIGTDNGCVRISSDATLSAIGKGSLMHSIDRVYSVDGNVYSIAEDKEGTVWLATSEGLVYFKERNFYVISTADTLQTNMVFKIAVGEKGRLWFGTDKGLGFYDKERKKVYHYNTTPTSHFFQNHVTALLYDGSGSLWIGTVNGLICLGAKGIEFYTKKDGLVNNSVTEIMEDADGNIWVGTWKGVSLIKGKKKSKLRTITNFTTKNGLPENFIYSIHQDSENNIWFGTHGGVSSLTSLNIMSYLKENGLPNELIIEILEDRKGRIWFGTSGGLGCYSMGKMETYTTADGLISNDVNALMEDCQGKIWIATLEGLSVFSSGTFTNYTVSKEKSDNILFCLAERKDGTIWIGSRNGIYCFIDGIFSLPPFKMKQNTVHCILEDHRGVLWFSSRANLYYHSEDRLTLVPPEAELVGESINAIFEDSKGKIWISTDVGLSCYTHGRFSNFPLRVISDHSCNFIFEDWRGQLWTGNSKSLACFNGNEFQIFKTNRMGLIGRTWISGATDHNGKLWFGSSEGVTCFFPPPIKSNMTPPPIHITSVKVMEKEISPYEIGRFNHEMNILRFNFVGLSFTSPDSVRYKYRLQNIDKDWQITQNRSLFYPFLPPGSYNLEVKAVNCDGIESIVPARYSFKILPPFWRTWWFFCLILLFGTMLLVLGVRWKIKRVREKEEQKNKETQLEARNRQLVISQRVELMGTLAAGTVHDLKNLMAIIVGYSQVMAQKYKEEKDDIRNIGIIKDTAATAVKMAKQILSFARPKNKKDHEAVDLRWVLTEILDTLKITQLKTVKIKWNPPAEPVRFTIEPARFQQLVMNLCLNACHAMPDGGELKISLTHLKKEVFLEIKDTGVGIEKELLAKIFDPMFTTKEHGKGTGLGLFVVKQVVEEYNGTIDVHSEPGKGTTFDIRFPTISKLQ